MRLVPVALVALLAAACGTGVLLSEPPPSHAIIRDVRGSWRGTWGGAPVTLLITGQRDHADASGLYVGTTPVLGHARPGVAAILTSEIRGVPTSVSAQGWFGGLDGQLALQIIADSPEGQQQLILRGDGPDRLVGMGDSSFRRGGGPSGPIELTRVGKPAA